MNGKIKKFLSSLSAVLTKSSIRNKLIFSFLLVSLVPLIIIGSISYISSRSALRGEATQYFTDGLLKTILNMQIKMESYENISFQLVADRDLNEQVANFIYSDDDGYTHYIERRNLEKSLERFQYSNEDISDLIFIDETKDHFISLGTHELPADSLSAILEPEFYQEIIDANGRVVWSPSPCNIADRPHFIAGRMIKELFTEKNLGVFLVFVPEIILDQVINFSLYQDPESQNIYFLLINSNAEIISAPEIFGKEYINENIFGLFSNNASLRKILDGVSENTGFFTKLFNDKVLITVEQMENYDWYLLGITPNSYLYKEANTVGITTLIMGIIFGGGAVFLSLLVAFNISNPLDRLVNAMRKVEKGDLTTRVRMENQDEVGYVGNCFNNMINKTNQLLVDTLNAAHAVFDRSVILKESSEQSAETSANVAGAIEEITKGTVEQSTEAEKSSRLMSQLAQQIDSIVNKSGEVDKITKATKSLSFKSKDTITLLVEKAQETDRITGAVTKDISDLNISTGEIRNITDVIAN